LLKGFGALAPEMPEFEEPQMETLTRLVADSLARHGLDRPVDPGRLQWSRWSRCDSPHSLLVVPSKPGIFALAEEIAGNVARAPSPPMSTAREVLGGAALQRCDLLPQMDAALAAEEMPEKRMLAVLQFTEADDMAFVLDRLFTRPAPLRARLASGRCFLRFVVIEDQAQRSDICNSLNQWLQSSAEKASGVAWAPSPASFDSIAELVQAAEPNREADSLHPAAHLDSGSNKNLHCPHPLPSGF
jgi:hypothetical protein